MGWQGIEGHDAIAARFAAAESRGRIVGTYLFLGPEGVGKGAFARALSRALVCLDPRPGLLPCEACPSCVQSAAGSHPDIDVVAKPEDRATIPLEALIGDRENRSRDGLCWRILLRPALARRKVAIILDADHLSEEGANCLLKTLEEPPDGVVIVLVGTSPERQLPTIRSRAQSVRFAALDAAVVAAAIRRGIDAGTIDASADDDTLAAAAARSGGSIDRALRFLDGELNAFRGRLLELLAARPLAGVELSREVQGVVEAAGKEAPPRRTRLRVILGVALEFFREALRRGAGGEVPAAVDDRTLERAVTAWRGTTEEAIEGAAITLDTLDGIDRNAHLPTLVDAWTARLERALGGRIGRMDRV